QTLTRATVPGQHLPHRPGLCRRELSRPTRGPGSGVLGPGPFPRPATPPLPSVPLGAGSGGDPLAGSHLLLLAPLQPPPPPPVAFSQRSPRGPGPGRDYFLPLPF